MAEGYEENIALLVRTTVLAYLELRESYKALPLPIFLPEEITAREIEQLHQVLMDAADRIEDLPVDPVAAQTLFAATYHLVSATTLTMVYITERGQSHLATAAWSLENAAELAALALYLLRQE